MKRLLILSLMAGLFVVTGCHNKNVTVKNDSLDLSNLDTTVSCGSDFYQYACGGWMKKNPLKPEYSRFGSFDQLRENNKEQLKDLIMELGKKKFDQGSIAQKVSDLYNLGLDSVRLNSESIAPLAAQIKDVLEAKDKKAFSIKIANLQKQGASPFFSLFVGADDKNSSENIVSLYQSGINMGDRDYYLLNDSDNLKIRNAYEKYVEKIFVLAGYKSEDAGKAAKSVLKTETKLANVFYTREKLRDPQINYNKMPFNKFAALTPAIDWNAYFEAMGVKTPSEINPMQLGFIKGMNSVISGLSPEEMQNYLVFHLLDAASPYMSDDFVSASFDFYGKTMSGKQEQQPRWKRSLEITSNALPEAVGEMYVDKFFPPEAKERMVKLVKNLQVALGQHIDSLEWMTSETKAKAKEKLDAVYIKIGYPDKWRDYSGLTIDKSDSYWENICRANEFEYNYMLDKIGKPVDKTEWGMSPQTVNAYYSPNTNEICFPAGILQPPFFYFDADDAVNYGAIGVVIGHEMTHGFDDQGRQYDKDGNLKDWWTAEDARQFNLRADKLADQYSSIIVVDTVHANGRFTLGENIADQGGLRVAYTAFKNAQKNNTEKIDGFTPDQRFYLAYAALWAMNIRDAEILRLTKIDPHSLGKWRVDMALKNIDTFYKAFDITPGDAMYLDPEKRVVIW
ncbi:M13 family metallopeptidase [Coprobacter tertius]|uniref:M13 family metallopeptidase n=1 Tax=Coprobacter tertius TaxID=2944915 RepID=A0ABT1MHQ4_9BACT|nr:M13 family metallopeptidase [Coprobacter tertius]MCP9612167.1 M13 family metallopeptidase [Coprobacter tertius]